MALAVGDTVEIQGSGAKPYKEITPVDASKLHEATIKRLMIQRFGNVDHVSPAENIGLRAYQARYEQSYASCERCGAVPDRNSGMVIFQIHQLNALFRAVEFGYLIVNKSYGFFRNVGISDRDLDIRMREYLDCTIQND
jgi:hypothetical protein